MVQIQKGRYRTRLATTEQDVAAAQALRGHVFLGGTSIDRDAFDPLCHHMLVENMTTGGVAACFRFMHLAGGTEIERSYSAQFYDLTALRGFDGAMVEMGRFCMDPARHDPDILRLAWAAMTAYVDREGVEMLFGCSSFRGTEPAEYHDVFALLRDRHLAPRRWLPRVKAPAVFRYANRLRDKPDLKRALAKMPPLLRTYLAMGGWVSDHAVIDRQLGTIHVFTGLEVKTVPPARARLLRAMAG